MDAMQMVKEKGKCCISSKPLSTSRHINMIELEFKASWNYPTAGNIIYGIKGFAVALVHDECFIEGKMQGEIKYAVEFTDNDIIYHPVPEIRKCSVCGCHEYDACYHKDAGTCWWVEPHLCSHCFLFPTEAKRFSKIMREVEANYYSPDVAELLKYEIAKFHLLHNVKQ